MTQEEFGFNSLQTGKYIWTDFITLTDSYGKGDTRVSIPFKRESTFGLCSPRITLHQHQSLPKWFQFPSNGKVHLDGLTNTYKNGENYRKFQFPSKRESTFGLVLEFRISVLRQGPQFQFPSNGKVHLDATQEGVPTWQYPARVSIPFKRESTFGLKYNSCSSGTENRADSFNSLQTGKYIWTKNALQGGFRN